MRLTLQQISRLAGVTRQAIYQRCRRESWPSCGTIIVNHNETKIYAIPDLPEDIQSRVHSSQVLSPLTCPAPAAPESATSAVTPARGFFTAAAGPDLLSTGRASRTPGPLTPASVSPRINDTPVTAIPPEAKRIALARMDLLNTWEAFRSRHGSLSAGDRAFDDWYNTGHGAPHLHDVLGRVSAKTLSRWRSELNGSNDWRNLVPRYKWSGMVLQTTLDPEIRRIFERFLLDPRRLKIAKCIFYTREALQLQGATCESSDAVFRRYADWFQTTHHDVWTFRREGNKALMDKVLFYIKRDPGLLEVGDCLVADGHRMNFQIVNPFTGRPARASMIAYLDWKSYDLAGYEIMIEENTQCIASALRHSMLKLGKRPRFCYQDNGKAFRAKYFTSAPSFEETGFFGLFSRFNIIPVFSLPYNARAKVIERWWGIFSESFERLLPSYVGASIDDKPAYLMRNEKFHKALRGEYTPTVWEAVELIDQWLGLWSSKTECPHVAGKSVRQVFDEGKGPGVDADELDDLMMDARITKIYQNGIRMWGGYYWHESLYGKKLDEVVVRYSIFDTDRIRVYAPNGIFLCTATRTEKMNPLVNYLGTDEEKARFKNVIEMRGRLRKSTVARSKQIEEAPMPIAVNAVVQPRVDGPRPGQLMMQQVAAAQAPTVEEIRSSCTLALPPEERRERPKLRMFECDIEQEERYEKWRAEHEQHQGEAQETF